MSSQQLPPPVDSSAHMPSSNTERRAQRQEMRQRKRALRRLSSMTNLQKETARQAVKEAAQVLSNRHISASATSNRGGRERSWSVPSLADLSEARARGGSEVASLSSHERAIQRGSFLGSFEDNERSFTPLASAKAGDDDDSSFPLPTSVDTGMDMTTTSETNASGQQNGFSGKVSIGKKKKVGSERVGSSKGGSANGDKKKSASSEKHSLTRLFKRKQVKSLLRTEIHSPEAWMCGVCAKTFSTMEEAEKHEDYHIKEVVLDLGWGIPGEDGPVVPPLELTPLRSNRSSSDGDLLVPPQGLITPPPPSRMSSRRSTITPQPQPDVLKKSDRKLSVAPPRVSRVQFQEKSFRNLPESANSHGLTDSRQQPVSSILRPAGSRVPPPVRTLTEEHDYFLGQTALLVPHGMKSYVILADEGLADCCLKAESLILTQEELSSEEHLSWLSSDKKYYDGIQDRKVDRQVHGSFGKFRKEGKNALEKVQNKLVDAYQLMKEGEGRKEASVDHYNKRKVRGDEEDAEDFEHTDKTMFVNVIVKNSVRVVSNELERLARQRWEDQQEQKKRLSTVGGMRQQGIGTNEQAERFQRFRARAQGNLVKLASAALASDFTPRRIAVQLSNDVYRLSQPRMKRYGVKIQAEIEYRVGAYFVIAVNIVSVDWKKLIKATHRDVLERRKRWRRDQEERKDGGEEKKTGVVVSSMMVAIRLCRLTRFEMLGLALSLMYYVHWVIYFPLCWLGFHVFFGRTFRHYFLQTVSDEIFVAVEEKGMEMQVQICHTSNQASFMLYALREVRADGREQKKKQQEGGEAKVAILGPLMGPAIAADKGAAPPKPAGFELPESLEFIGLELDLPVGFRRLRWAMLSSKSTFISEALYRTESKYDNITMGEWNSHNDAIGEAKLPDGVKDEDLLGAERVASYLMPASAFVKANVCTETWCIEAYNDYCFVLKKKALTPDVPYGSTFVAWTKYIVINTGANTCKMTCSVEAEFPNGPPMIARQIKSGMRTGVGELFVATGETISKYADEYP